MKKYCLFFTVALLCSAPISAMKENAEDEQKTILHSTHTSDTDSLPDFDSSSDDAAVGNYTPLQPLTPRSQVYEQDVDSEQSHPLFNDQFLAEPRKPVYVSNALRYPIIGAISLGAAAVVYKLCTVISKNN